MWGIAAFSPFSRLRFSTFLGSDHFILMPEMHLTLVIDALFSSKALLADLCTGVQVIGYCNRDHFLYHNGAWLMYC